MSPDEGVAQFMIEIAPELLRFLDGDTSVRGHAPGQRLGKPLRGKLFHHNTTWPSQNFRLLTQFPTAANRIDRDHWNPGLQSEDEPAETIRDQQIGPAQRRSNLSRAAETGDVLLSRPTPIELDPANVASFDECIDRSDDLGMSLAIAVLILSLYEACQNHWNLVCRNSEGEIRPDSSIRVTLDQHIERIPTVCGFDHRQVQALEARKRFNTNRSKKAEEHRPHTTTTQPRSRGSAPDSSVEPGTAR